MLFKKKGTDDKIAKVKDTKSDKKKTQKYWGCFLKKWMRNLA